MNSIGKRVIIVGISASGKSTFARNLAEKLGLPLYSTDSIMWKPNWNYVGDDIVARQLNDLTSQHAWILEGYLIKSTRRSIFDTADTIIYLDYSPIVAALRYILRWRKHHRHSRPELPGSPDTFSWNFLKRIWTKQEAISLDRFLNETASQQKIIRLSSPHQGKHFLEHL